MDVREPSTFNRLYADHAREVEAIARRILGDRAQAQDVAQDVFLRLWSNPAAYDPARGEIGAYLRMMARSRAIDAQRSHRTAARAGDRLRDACGPLVAEPETTGAELREERHRLGRALRTLPGPQREAVVLTYWADLPDHQVARRAGIPVGTAKSRIRLGLRRLRAEYGALEPAV